MARKDVTVPMDESLDEQIAAELEYGDSKAAWIREAIMMRLESEADWERPDELETDGGRVTLAD